MVSINIQFLEVVEGGHYNDDVIVVSLYHARCTEEYEKRKASNGTLYSPDETAVYFDELR